MINDTIDVLDARIINVGINFEVLGDLDINRYELLQRCTNYLKENLIKVKGNIGEAFYISDVFKMLNDVPGVTDTISVEMINKSGGVYSEYVYDINSNLSDDGRFLKVPPNSVMEILLPDLDISGVIK